MILACLWYSGPDAGERLGVAATSLAEQSWNFSSYPWYTDACRLASNAVDGNPDPVFNDLSCSHTDLGTTTDPSWWAVDLELVIQVCGVAITGRSDANRVLL